MTTEDQRYLGNLGFDLHPSMATEDQIWRFENSDFVLKHPSMAAADDLAAHIQNPEIDQLFHFQRLRIALENQRMQHTALMLEYESKNWQRLAMENEAKVVSLTGEIERLTEIICHMSNPIDDAESFCDETIGVDRKREEEGGSEREEMMTMCKRCNGRISCVVFLPCRHLCACTNCQAFLHCCPVCKKTKTLSLVVSF